MHGLISCFCLIIFILLSNSASAQKVSLSEPVENWKDLVRSSNVETKYQVKEGDNLYDISDILFGDAHYWPKVWSLNIGLTNPHEIEIGQIVYFDSGNIARPPSISLASTEAGTFLLAESFKDPIIPKKAPKSYIKNLPRTLPQRFGSVSLIREEEELLNDIEVGERFVLDQDEQILLYTEILNKQPEMIGQVGVTENDSTFAKLGDFVVLSLKSSVSVGQMLSVYEVRIEKGLDKEKFSVIDWLGEVQVVKPVGNKGDKYKALVTRVNQDIFKGAFVSLRPLRNFTYKNKEDKPKLSVKDMKIIGGEGALSRVVFNDGDLVYLNKGLKDGVTVGDVFYVERSLAGYYYTKADDVPGAASLVKIVSSDSTHSTGVLYNMTNLISTGLETRTDYY